MSQPGHENLLLHPGMSQFSISNPHARMKSWLKEMEVADKGNKADVRWIQADEGNTKLVLPGLLPCASGGVMT